MSYSSNKVFTFSARERDVNIIVDTDEFKWRAVFPYLLLAAGFVYLMFSAFELQIVKGGENFQLAKRTNQAQVKTLAPRGLIISEDGVRLASNSPAYSLSVNTKEVGVEDENEVIGLISQLLNIPSDELLATFKAKAYDSETAVRLNATRLTLKNNLSYDEYYAILSRIEDLPGVVLNVEAVRKYVDPKPFSNVIGYLGDPTQSDVDNGIYSQAQIGKTGIEAFYDSELRGREGLLVEELEAVTGDSVNYEAYEPIPGNNVYVTINSKWQTSLSSILEESINSVGAFAGAGVIVNSKTGEIKALVTSPSYDNNEFAAGISSTSYSELINNPKRPLFNRPIALQLPPGSIIKVVGATAGLESGVINETSEKLSDRCMDLPGGIVFCEADRSYIGWVNVEGALARSSNLFFCQVMQDLRAKVGYSYYYDIARNYGLGQKLGIDLPGEGTGTIPNEEYKLRAVGEPWYIGDECNTVIGQGYVTVTPLQMAMVASTIYNNGNLMTPHLLSRIEDQSGKIVKEFEPAIARNIHVSTETLRILQEGMKLGVEAGTAGALKGLPGNPRAKTGSSDAGEWIDGKYYSGAHSWVMGCFDYVDENYCFTVMQQWGGRGYKTVPIMKKFINCLYNDFQNGCEKV